MADAKITALPADTVMSNDDLLVKVDDPSGGAVTKKISWLNFVTAAMNSMGYSTVLGDIVDIKADIVDLVAKDVLLDADIAALVAVDASLQLDILALQTALNSLEYGQIYVHEGVGSQTLSSGAYSKITQFTANGLATANITPSHTTDQIVIGRTGIYLAHYSLSFGGTANVTWEFAPFLDGVEVENAETTSKITATGDKKCISAFGFIDVTSVPKYLDLRGEPDGASKSISVTNGNLILLRLGPT